MPIVRKERFGDELAQDDVVALESREDFDILADVSDPVDGSVALSAARLAACLGCIDSVPGAENFEDCHLCLETSGVRRLDASFAMSLYMAVSDRFEGST
jgi:hypothetical protein